MYRTNELSDYRTIGLTDRNDAQTIGLAGHGRAIDLVFGLNITASICISLDMPKHYIL